MSVVRIARAAAGPARRRASASTARGSAAVIFSACGGSPMTPVEEMKTSRGVQPSSLAVAAAVRLDRLPSGAAGEGVGVAGIGDDRPRRAARQVLAAPDDRRAPRRRAGEDAGDRRARRRARATIRSLRPL